MPNVSPTSTASVFIGAIIMMNCGRKRAGSAIAFTIRLCRPNCSKRSPRTSRSSNRPPCCVKPTAGFGPGRGAMITEDAVTDRVPMFGIMPRQFRTFFLRLNGHCGKRNSALRKMTRATSNFAVRCPSARWSTISTRRLTASSAAS